MKYLEIPNHDPLMPKKIICYEEFEVNHSKRIIKVGDMLTTVREVADENWKTQLARGYKNIPKDTQVEVVGFTNNLYGHFIDVKYNGIRYSVKPQYLVWES